MSSWIQNLIILVGIIALGAAAYYIFVQQGIELNTSGSDVNSIEVQAQTQSLLQQLNDLRSVDISTDLYSSERFQTLTNYTRTPRSQPVGRDNPFQLP